MRLPSFSSSFGPPTGLIDGPSDGGFAPTFNSDSKDSTHEPDIVDLLTPDLIFPDDSSEAEVDVMDFMLQMDEESALDEQSLIYEHEAQFCYGCSSRFCFCGLSDADSS